jgi:hypothetical protein
MFWKKLMHSKANHYKQIMGEEIYRQWKNKCLDFDEETNSAANC